MLYGIGETFYLEVEYEDSPNEAKRRPAIIIDKKEDSLFILVSTTSQSPSDPPSYFDQFKIPILNWRNIGLSKPSWGLGYRLIELTENEFKSVVKRTDYIGHMSERDLQYLIAEIELIHNKTS
jgi:mRNA interferase MazF